MESGIELNWNRAIKYYLFYDSVLSLFTDGFFDYRNTVLLDFLKIRLQRKGVFW